MHNLTEGQKAYLAACIDGDGCFSIQKQETKYNKFSYSSNITIANTNIKLLKNIKKITEIGNINISRKLSKNRKECYQWQFKKHQQKLFIDSILPYLVIKMPRSKLILEYLELSKIKYNKWHPRPDSVEDEIDIVWEELKEYNLRGPNNKYYNKNPIILTTNHIRQMNYLSYTQINYIAGLIDTEGYIGLTRDKLINSNDWIYTFHIKIGNTDINLLNYMIKITNFGKIILGSDETLTKKRSWNWLLIKSEMKSFLSIIKSNLIIKQRQAEILLETIDLTKIEYNKWYPRPKDISDKLDTLYYEIEELNQVGPTQFYE